MPLPVRVIAELIGVEPERFEDFRGWSQAVVAAFGRVPSAEERARSRVALDAMDDYFEQTVERRRKEPQTDLISVLLEREEAEDMSFRVPMKSGRGICLR